MFICKLLPIDITNEYSFLRSVSGYNTKSLSVDYRATRAGQQYLRTIQK